MRQKTRFDGFLFGLFCCLIGGIALGATLKDSEMETQEHYRQDAQRIKDWERSFRPGQVSNLAEYEKLADEIQERWSQKNKEYGARLVLELCRTLSSVDFKDERRHDLARKYALLVLDKPEKPSLEMELELTGHVMTAMGIPTAPKGEEFAQRRKKDVEIRLHAWKRLMDAIDPNWDPNDLPLSNVVPPAMSGLPSGATPEAIKDSKLRAEYEAAIEKNRQKAEKYNEQYKLRGWLKRFPPRAERYIIQAYSKPPYNIEELTGLLNQYMRDEQTRMRVLDAVKKRMDIAMNSKQPTK